jgi:hypothetical protein
VLVVIVGGVYELTKSNSPSPVPPTPVAATHVAAPVLTPLESLLARVSANALAEKSVRTTVTDASGRHRTVTYRDDDAVNGGIQRISSRGGHVVARVVGPTTYFTGNRQGLTKLLGLTSAQASQVRGHWVALTKGQRGYASVTDGITLASSLAESGLKGPLHRLPVRVRHGQRVFGIRGTPTGAGMPRRIRATLWIRVGAHPLPVEFDQRGPHFSTIVRLSRWGRAVQVKAPARAIVETNPSAAGTPTT